MFPLPVLDSLEPILHQENRHARVTTSAGAAASDFDACCLQLLEAGYEQAEAYTQGTHRFAAFRLEDCGVFVNYYDAVHELRIVQEDECTYFDFSDRPAKASTPPQLTQLSLEHFGMSYVIRLSDGRQIVIDGGRNIEADCHKLYARLKADTPFDKPVIAAWILTHPHSDHFHCFLGFMELYAEQVTIERFLFNFPEPDDYAHYPGLTEEGVPWDYDLRAVTNVPVMQKWIAHSGAAVYTPHTGQRYAIGDAQLEVLSCMDDTIHLSQNVNATSLVLRMTLGGQVILWATDAGFSYARLAERYGDFLKADILQIPHHGFQSGTAEGELAAYAFIRPRICLLPADEFFAYTFFCAYRPGTRSLMLAEETEAFFTGGAEHTLPLPYTPEKGFMTKILQQFRQGQESAGARMWFFTGLSTARPEDFVFTLINTLIPTASVRIDLYFEQKVHSIRNVQTEVTGSRMKVINLKDELAQFNATTHTPGFFPEDVPFAVRFLSDLPVVIAHEKHRATMYHTVPV